MLSILLSVFIVRAVLARHSTPYNLFDLLISYVDFEGVFQPLCSLSEYHLLCLALVIAYHFVSL
jgi:hypothetical protein